MGSIESYEFESEEKLIAQMHQEGRPYAYCFGGKDIISKNRHAELIVYLFAGTQGLPVLIKREKLFHYGRPTVEEWTLHKFDSEQELKNNVQEYRALIKRSLTIEEILRTSNMN